MCLAGCGVLPRVAQQTTAAAIAPVATTARIVSRDLRAVSQNLAASSVAAERTSRQVAQTTAQTRAQTRAATRAANQRREQMARTAERNATVRKQMAEDGVEPEAFDVLPAAILAKLTEDQAALQRAAQKEAFTAPVGETIFWEDSGRAGTAMAEDEKPMGGFICRTFIQTVLIDTAEERASALACKSPDGIWEASLGRRGAIE